MDDSFDLFGGLPTVGGGGPTDDSVPAKTIEATQTTQTKDTTTTIDTSTKNTNQDIKPSAATASTTVGVVKLEALADKPKEGASSLVSSIGTSGTKLVSYAHIDIDIFFVIQVYDRSLPMIRYE